MFVYHISSSSSFIGDILFFKKLQEVKTTAIQNKKDLLVDNGKGWNEMFKYKTTKCPADLIDRKAGGVDCLTIVFIFILCYIAGRLWGYYLVINDNTEEH